MSTCRHRATCCRCVCGWRVVGAIRVPCASCGDCVHRACQCFRIAHTRGPLDGSVRRCVRLRFLNAVSLVVIGAVQQARGDRCAVWPARRSVGRPTDGVSRDGGRSWRGEGACFGRVGGPGAASIQTLVRRRRWRRAQAMSEILSGHHVISVSSTLQLSWHLPVASSVRSRGRVQPPRLACPPHPELTLD